MKFFLTFFCITCCLFSLAQEQNLRPKIGLSLSGGGAKGQAHIGILKAIDSAGLKVDYITGTSMGAIMGALYAVGYSGVEIEKLVKDIDWDELFSNNISLKALSMEEKDQYSRYAVELPYANNKITLQTGLIKGQELSLKFAELFFHVYHLRDFNKLPIPFKCMATDLETGNLVILDTGNITTALSATMAIPTVFSAVSRDGKKLVDGGLVRNFPVKNVIEMGADIVIGSNVTNGLSKIERIKNPIDVLLQMAFFKEAVDFKEEVPLCDIYIHMPMEKYFTGSFASSKDILEVGMQNGRKFYPVFKKLADSINALSSKKEQKVIDIKNNVVYIIDYKVKGLQKTTVSFFIHLMDFNDSRYYTASQISRSIRKAYGSRYYNYITYSLEQVAADSARIIFTVEENPATFIKAGLYYTKFRGINVNVNITSRDFVIPNSRSTVAVSLGESIQLEAEHLQYLGRTKTVAFITGFRLDNLKINSFHNFKSDGAYNQNHIIGFLNFQNSGSNKFVAGTGMAVEYINYRPVIHSQAEAKGSFSSLKSYIYFKYNNVNLIFYPTKGSKLNLELAYVNSQRPRLKYFENGIQAPDLNFDNFPRIAIDGSTYKSINSKFSFFSEFQAGINFTNKPNVLNNFQIGGINGSFRNQIRFAGLTEATVNSSSAAALLIGLRYTVANNLYVIGRVNGMIKNFATFNNATSSKSFLSGYALTFAYKSPIGPLELSAMYSDQSKRLQSYVLFGIPF